MLTLPKWFLRCAVGYLLLGAGIGLHLMLAKAWGLWSFDARWIPVHSHCILVGFFLFMVCGVSLWMFPRPPGREAREVQGDRFGWAAFALLNVGLLLRIALEPRMVPGAWSGWLLGCGGVCQLLGIAAYGLAVWPRIIERKRREEST